MKKFLYMVFIVIILSGLFVFLQAHKADNYLYQYDYKTKDSKDAESLKSFNLYGSSQNEKQAIKLLSDYVKSDDSTNYILAVKYDLNDDGEDEIIGVDASELNCGHTVYCFYILEKTNEKYKNIAYLLLNRDYPKIKILKNKTNGFYDLEVSGNEKTIPNRTIKFN